MLAAAEDKKMFDLVEKTKSASLSTVRPEDDIPFTSFVPFALDKGTPIIFISELAVHTKNLDKNSKCSLMVVKVDKKDLMNSQRITFIGKMKKVDDKEVKELKKLYLERFPDAEYLMELEDFSFYRMEIDKIYYIGGFGEIEWIKAEDYKTHWK